MICHYIVLNSKIVREYFLPIKDKTGKNYQRLFIIKTKRQGDKSIKLLIALFINITMNFFLSLLNNSQIFLIKKQKKALTHTRI